MRVAPALERVISGIAPLNAAAMAEARARLDSLTKPPGSLGRLEALAVTLAGITGRARPALAAKCVMLMAGDHGVVAEGVSAYPQAVTAQMVRNFLAGGAAINVLARRAGARVTVVDVGVAAELEPHPALVVAKIAHGTKNIACGPAMSREQALAAIETGGALFERERAAGLDLVATGDMGIGNTTAASAIVAALTGESPAAATGRGTGLDDAGIARKAAVVERALAVNRPDPNDAFDVLAKMGGFEIAGLVGVILAAAAARVPVLLDGFISGAAALVAVRLCPQAQPYLIASHRSAEPGHAVALRALAAEPLLDLDMRLGEGSGAALAMHLIDAALAVLNEMATFEEAGVARRPDGA